MKTLITVAILLFSVEGFSQTKLFGSSAELESHDTTYCQMYARAKGGVFTTATVQLYIDYGTGAKRVNQGKRAKPFRSVIDGLNWMAESNWRVVQTYALTRGDENVYHFLLERN